MTAIIRRKADILKLASDLLKSGAARQEMRAKSAKKKRDGG